MTDLVAKHGGYKNLKSFQTAEIIYDLTVNFCKIYMTYKSNLSHRTVDQMIQAARSGKQNIAEASTTSGTSKQSELRLMDVARASLEELLQDYLDFLRQNNLPVWEKDDSRAVAIRQLAYKSNRSYMTYKSYLSNAETAANCLLCVINQACFLLDRLLGSLEKDFKINGDFKDRYKQVRKQQMFGANDNYNEFLKQFNMKILENGKVVKINENK